MTVLVTGAAGFIGYHVARRLAERGERVLGLDNLNDFYGVELKRRRLVQLATFPNFRFERAELTDRAALEGALKGVAIRSVVHLAAQANVRYALENPHAYIDSNVVAHLNLLEHFRHAGVENFVYASSSSVYGRGGDVPFREDSDTDHPTSIYAATKKSQELMSEVYSGLFKIPFVGLRFFSVYGPWGRPDMAYWLFTESILRGRPIRVFNNGEMERDFTYIDDVVGGVLAANDNPADTRGDELHRIYNLGNNRPIQLMDMIATLEDILGKRAQIEMLPAQPGEMTVTYADITRAEEELGYRPRTPIGEGLKRFVDWFRRYQGMMK